MTSHLTPKPYKLLLNATTNLLISFRPPKHTPFHHLYYQSMIPRSSIPMRSCSSTKIHCHHPTLLLLATQPCYRLYRSRRRVRVPHLHPPRHPLRLVKWRSRVLRITYPCLPQTIRTLLQLLVGHCILHQRWRYQTRPSARARICYVPLPRFHFRRMMWW